MEDTAPVVFDKMFDISELQKLQDQFSTAFGVASIITTPEGKYITQPSNFSYLCQNIIRCTKKGMKNCMRSDAFIGRHNPGGAIIQTCLSGGLWDAGASITVSGKHVANWLVGQVRSEHIDEVKLKAYAREIDVDEDEFFGAYLDVPVTTADRFKLIADMLFTMAQMLSDMAYKNLEKSMIIEHQKQIEEEIKLNEERLESLLAIGSYQPKDIKDLFCFALNESVKITRSELGYIYLYSEESKEFTLDTAVIKQQAVAISNEKRVVYSVHDLEAFGEVINQRKPIINNDLSESFNLRFNDILPEAEINRSMLFPVLSGAKMVALIIVANKSTDYTDADTRQMLLMIDAVWKILNRINSANLLIESELKFRNLFENSPIGKSITKIDGSLNVNKAFCEMLGYTQEELAGKKFRDITHPEDLNLTEELGLKLIAGEQSKGSIEKRYIHKNGSIIWAVVSVFLQRDKDGKPDYFITIIDDITRKKEMEEALRESEFFFRETQKSGFIGSYRFDVENGLWYSSDVLDEIFGIGKNYSRNIEGWVDIIHPEDQEIMMHYLMDEVIGKGFSFNREYRIIRKTDKAVRWLLGLGNLVFDSAGKVKDMLGTIQDITERKEAELEQIRLMNIIDRSLNEVYIFDAESLQFEYVNQGALLNLGYSIDEIKLLTAVDINPECSKELFGKLIEPLISGKEKQLIFETIHSRKNGTEYPVEVHLQLDRSGVKSSFIAIINDITQRKKSDYDLKESEKKFRTLVESSADGISLLDLKGNILFSNRRNAQMIGVDSENEMIGRSIFSLVGKKYHEMFEKLNDQFLETGYLRNVETEIVRNDGSTFWAELNLSLMRDENNNPSYIMDSIRDISERKQAEEKLRESEIELKRAQMVSHVGNWVWNIQRNSLEWSDEMYRIFGIDKTTFTGKLDEVIQKCIHPDDQEKVIKSNLAVINDSKPVPLEYRIIWPDQSVHIIWAEAGYLEFDDNNKPYQLRGIVQDITERKQAMEAIVQERQLLRTLIDNIPDSIFIKDVNCRKIAANSTDVERMGFSSEKEALGKTDVEIYDGETGLRGYAGDLAVITTGVPLVNKEQSFDDRHGGIRWSLVSKYPLFDQNGKVTGLVGITRDITEQKKAQETILKLTKGIEQSPATIVITDKFGVIEYANPRFCETTGYSLEEAIGQNPRILKSGEMNPEAYKNLWDKISSGDVWRGEFHNRKKNGELYWESATITSIKNDQGQITNYIAIKEDISMRKLMEADLIVSKEKAEESDRLKSAFLANMSHEIRTPLNSIIGFSELLTDASFDSGQKDEFIQHIIENGNYLLNIISDIVDLSKIEAGEITIRKKPVTVCDLVDEVKRLFSYKIESKSLKFVVNTLPCNETIFVLCDRERVMQIFANLLNNALKFTTKGYIEVGFRVLKTNVEFYVKDTGIGIPEKFHNKVFDRFTQVETSYNRRVGGNGLGLSISKNLIELMDGHIWLESEFGRGSTFYFTLNKC